MNAVQQATPPASLAASPDPYGAYRFRLGRFDLRVFDDGEFVLPFDWFAANARPRALAEAVSQGNLSTDIMPLRINNLLIDTVGQLVLVDAGCGSIGPGAGKLPLALRAEGIAPEEIDVVLLTHLHPDHAGGALDAAGKPAFPNARNLVNRIELEFWLADPSLIELPFPNDFKQFVRQFGKDTAVALQNRIEQVEPEDEVAPGHTPGHLAAQPVLHLQHPDWFMKVDLWPTQSIMTWGQLLDQAVAENLLVQTYHFAFPGLGRVRAAGDDWLWEPVA